MTNRYIRKKVPDKQSNDTQMFNILKAYRPSVSGLLRVRFRYILTRPNKAIQYPIVLNFAIYTYKHLEEHFPIRRGLINKMLSDLLSHKGNTSFQLFHSFYTIFNADPSIETHSI